MIRASLRSSLMLLLVGAVCAATPTAASSAQAGQKRVLVVYANRADFNANMVVDRTLRAGLASFGDDLDLYNEYIDTIRFPDLAHQLALREYLRRKYAGVSIDVVVGIAGMALDFLHAYRQDLFPNVPIVVLGQPSSVAPWRGERHVTGAEAAEDTPGTVALMLRLQPRLKRIICIAGSSASDAFFVARARTALAEQRKVDITYLTGLRVSDLESEVGRLPPETAVLFLSMVENADGRRLPATTVLRRITQASRVPVYGISVTYLEGGILGGKLFSQEIVTRHAADLVARLLHGAAAHDLPFRVVDAAVPMIDWERSKHWGLDTANLPADVVVLNRPPSAWQQYKWQIVLIASICVMQSALIAGLLIQRRRRLLAERKMHEQREQLTHLGRVATFGELSGALAHELNQPLTAILSNAQAAQRLATRTPVATDQLQEALVDIVDADKRAATVITRVRSMLKKADAQMAPINVTDVAIESLALVNAELITRRVTTNTRWTSGLPLISGDRVQLQQVLVNLVLNACDAMHRMPIEERKLTLFTSTSHDGFVRIGVCDQGVGIPPNDIERVFDAFFSSKTHGLGLGLSICRSIVTAHGGRLWAANNPDRGVTFNVLLPVMTAANVDTERGQSPDLPKAHAMPWPRPSGGVNSRGPVE